MAEYLGTKKLYDENAYAVTFEAEVLSVENEVTDGITRYAVVLNQTLFFPEEGGQSSDKGVLGDAKVIDVQIRKNGLTETIYHYTDKPLTTGAILKGEIDWKHRFSNMQQHSGEHIFSGFVNRKFGYENVGFHLSDQIVTMDYNGLLTEEEIAEIERETNEAIVSNLTIEARYPEKEELENLAYRSKIELEGPVRIVTIPGIDVCACCAPHVRQTGEIGMLKVMNIQNYKGGIRLSILCGFRALEAFREKNAVVSELMSAMSSPQEKLLENTNRFKDTISTLKIKYNNAMQSLMDAEIHSLQDGYTDVVLFKQGLEGPAIRNTVNHLMERCNGICALFVGDDRSGYQFVIGSKSTDCKQIANRLRENLQAKGGGSSQMIQGTIEASGEAIVPCLNLQEYAYISLQTPDR